MTKPEVLLWSRLRRRQVVEVKFRRQHSIGPYIVDFYCSERRLVVEVDGPSHFEAPAAEGADRRRDRFMVGKGLRVLRFTNHQVAGELDSVVETIRLAVEEPDQGV